MMKKNLKTKIIFFLVIFLVFLIASSTAVLAQSGLVRIPLVSAALYTAPQPVRRVIIEDIENFQFEDFHAGRSEDQNLYSLQFGEKDLTYLLKSVLRQSGNQLFGTDAQIAIINSELEFFGTLNNRGKTPITLRLKPYVADESFEYKITKFKVGNLALPAGLTDWLVKKYFNAKAADLFTPEDLKPIFYFKSLTVQDESIEFVVNFDFMAVAGIVSQFSK